MEPNILKTKIDTWENANPYEEYERDLRAKKKREWIEDQVPDVD